MATKDLKLSDKLISDIAIEHGFTNIKAFNTAFRNSFGRSPSSYRSSPDKETIEIDAEFKKVFLYTNHPYWIEAKKRWNEEKPEINQKSLEFNIDEKAKIQEETLNKAIKTLENLKNKI